MAVSPAVRVGILVFLAVLAFVLVLWFMGYLQLQRETYYVKAIFTNSLGVMEGDPVRMAGVPIGSVRDLSLTSDEKARMLLGINRKYRIPRGSQFVVRVGLLIGERYIEIAPNREAREYLRRTSEPPYPRVIGEVPPRFEDLLPEAKTLVSNLSETSESLRKLLTSEELQTSFKQSLANINMATMRLNAAMATIQNAVIRNQDEVDAITANALAAAENVRAMAAELEEFARSGELQENVTATVRSARETIESLDRTVTSLEKLVTAPEFQEDVRETVSGARQAVEEAREVIGRVGGIFGGGPRFRAKIPTRGFNLDMLYSPDAERFRAEVSATIPTGKERFLELGVFDVGAGNKFILQPGQGIGSRTDLRYGIYASRLGLGLDHAFSSRTFGRLDLFDPYEPKLNLRTGYKVSDDWAVLLGVEDLFDENQAVLGVKLNR